MTNSPDLAPPLAFTPVPSATNRRDGWTPERQLAFIGTLAECGVVKAAARAVGMSAKSAHLLRQREGAEEFAAAWDHAIGEGRSRAFALAIARGIHGTVTPVFYNGKQVGERVTYDNRLILAALRIHVRDQHGAGARPAPLPGHAPWDF
ncbi:hypothetical protein [Sphingomonas sp. ID0503]|uniref:hypothetical protein n=1 Tax=Sphingomonas sp. ID0503 TaxID=3399691 RepID=UPI003AFB6372